MKSFRLVIILLVLNPLNSYSLSSNAEEGQSTFARIALFFKNLNPRSKEAQLKQLTRKVKRLERKGLFEEIFVLLATQEDLTQKSWLNFIQESLGEDFLMNEQVSKFFMQYMNIARLRIIFRNSPQLYSFFVKKAKKDENYRGNLALISEIYESTLPKHDNPKLMHQEIDEHLRKNKRHLRSQYSEHVPTKIKESLFA